MEVTAAGAALSLATARLELLPCTRAWARLALEDPRALGAELGVAVPRSWPHPGVLGLLGAVVDSPAGEASERGWGPWFLLHRPARVLVGEAGFKGFPDRDGVVEIGYSIVPAHRRRGLATEAVGRLLEWALLRPEVRVVRAECDPANHASIAVLRGLGMQRIGAVEEVLTWELRRSF
jgi:ribosomal-protein-alanine N-acetyltransferase